eukprot:CAMPEP_0202357470 /NCGR_PEP_ID=MMETSP1126-20121109/11483_1 /ASSEMBLY_ACC=CAM_ASM_000457 /TAXON_ID=3047 /ORGANISM="Dunaliella tertiolecta, Strain CCMP1320" /LENGTH=560 /DNA_ID=CAMNT_0048950355 /DNA_START=43 /DNA_END=1726 /DNA_ORIENTATION=-
MPRQVAKPMSQTKVNVSVCLAAVIAGGAMWFGNVGSTFNSVPDLFSTIFTSFKETELFPYKCKSPDGSEDFNLLKELMDRGGAIVDAVGLGTFDGIRGLQALRPIPKGQVIVALPYTFSLSVATITASSQAGQAAARWRYMPDGDMHLDTLALIYEAHVRGAKSPWKNYFCTLPKEYDLPLLYNDAWSKEFLAALPDFNRFVNKRRAELATFEGATRTALQQMPGGSALLKNISRAEFSDLHTKSYLAAKTRTLTWDMEEAGENKFKLNLPSSLAWLEEVGFMVPILDMANHASKEAANAAFTIDYTGSHIRKDLGGLSSLGDERPARANQNSNKASKGRGMPTFSLIAQKDIQSGEQITFPYLPEDDIHPQCNDRWLLEYGIVQHDGHPMRDCYAFNVTVADLVRVTKGPQEADDGQQQVAEAQSHVQQTLKAARAFPWITVRLVRSGIPSKPLLDDDESMGLKMLLQWATAALEGDAAQARSVACVLLKEQAARLDQQLAHMQELATAMDAEESKADTEGGEVKSEGAGGGRLSRSRRADLLQVLEEQHELRMTGLHT